MVRARDVVEGAVDDSDLARISPTVDLKNRRTALRMDDLLVVLVGRIGDTAVAAPRQEGWNVARSVAVIRFTPAGLNHGINTWIRWWLGAPETRELLRAGSAGAEHATLPLGDLKQLPVSLPPRLLRTRILRTMDLAERKIALNSRIVECATELADAHFSRLTQEGGHARRPGVAVADVARVIGGAPRSAPVEGAAALAWASPREVLNSTAAHLERTTEITWAPVEAVCPPGTLLVAPRPGEVRTVAAAIPVVPGRGMLAIRTDDEADRMWLLHELRSRSGDLVTAVQGEQTRAMSRKKFAVFPLFWPAGEVRERFARIVTPLHDRSLAALRESRALQDLVVSEMTMSPGGER
ncbi:hypothetical protein [Streptomyces anulatus]|nr:hypothetical protein [Streptomyces anulatus]